MAKTKDKEPSFETSLSSLEQIVGQLESGELPLERALELFEDGVALARRCQSQLQDAERKVELLLRERGEIKVVPFDSNGSQTNESDVQTEKSKSDKEELDDSIPF
jgi:exodeoxyribonuclease VII small subunit